MIPGGRNNTHRPNYEGHQIFMPKGGIMSAWELRRAPRVGNEWPGLHVLWKTKRVRGMGANILVQLWGFCDFVWNAGIRNAKRIQNSWDEYSNQLTQLKPPFPFQKQGSFYEPKHCKQFFFLRLTQHWHQHLHLSDPPFVWGNVNAEININPCLFN